MILAFTGAGISKDSGIDTFEENTGLRDKLFRTYAQSNPHDYRATIETMKKSMDGKSPNQAHIALAKNQIPVITLNIDNLHQDAGTKELIPLHGTLPTEEELPYCDTLYEKPVLYGDPAEKYQIAYEIVSTLQQGDIFLVIGASTHTGISVDLRRLAKQQGATVAEIQQNASVEVPLFLENHKALCETLQNRGIHF